MEQQARDVDDPPVRTSTLTDLMTMMRLNSARDEEKLAVEKARLASEQVERDARLANEQRRVDAEIAAIKVASDNATSVANESIRVARQLRGELDDEKQKTETNSKEIEEIRAGLVQTNRHFAEAMEKSQNVLVEVKKIEEDVTTLRRELPDSILEQVEHQIEPHVKVVQEVARQVQGESSQHMEAIAAQRKLEMEAIAEVKHSVERLAESVRFGAAEARARHEDLAERVNAIDQNVMLSERNSDEGARASDELSAVPSGEPPDPDPPDGGLPRRLWVQEPKTPAIKSNRMTGNEQRTLGLEAIRGEPPASKFVNTQVPQTPEAGAARATLQRGKPEPSGVKFAALPPEPVLDARVGNEVIRRPMSAHGAGVVVNVTPIPHGSKLRDVNLKSLKNLLDKVYAEYQRIAIDATHTLVDFISEGVLEDLVRDMRRKGHPLAKKIDMRNIHKCANDDLVTDMLMEFVRPKYKGQYESMMYGAVTQFPKGRSATFVTADYDEIMAKYVDDIVADVQLYHSYMTHNISAEQKLILPGMAWGEVDAERSVIQIAMQCLEPYAKQFKSIIGSRKSDVKLKSVGSLESWAKIVLEINDQFANLAIQVRNSDFQALPVEKAEVIQTKARDLQMQKSFIGGKGEKQETGGKRRHGEGELHRIEYEWQRYDYDGYDAYGWEQQQQRAARAYGPQLNAYDWENPRRPERGPQPVRAPQRAPGRGLGYGGRDGGRGGGRGPDIRMGPRGSYGARPPADRGGRGPPPPRGPPPREFEAHKPLVCYKFAVGNCDKGKDCEYAHDPDLASKYLHMKVKYFSDSKWYKPLPASDSSRLAVFAASDREEEDWYEMQRKILEEELAAAGLEEEKSDFVESYEPGESVVDGYDAAYYS